MSVVVSLLPVSVFLLLLVLFDSFKLVPTLMIVRALVAGGVAALVMLPVHAWLRQRHRPPIADLLTLRRAASPKRRSRRSSCSTRCGAAKIGFLVDAAIVGFAIGAGFALVENIDYLGALGETRMLVWIVRGFGTAILHATTTAIVAIAAKSLADRFPRTRLAGRCCPGWAAAVTLHSLFNHALVSPLLAAGVLMLVLPLVVITVFGRSERMTREWVGDGLDLDVELLALVRSMHFGGTRLGRYLTELTIALPRSRRRRHVLSAAARSRAVDPRQGHADGARGRASKCRADPELRNRLEERAYLHRTIGPTGLLALRPLQMTNDRDDWHQYLLRNAK